MWRLCMRAACVNVVPCVRRLCVRVGVCDICACVSGYSVRAYVFAAGATRVCVLVHVIVSLLNFLRFAKFALSKSQIKDQH